jgi:protocatechuate 3,4-dioxygenase beta subunit
MRHFVLINGVVMLLLSVHAVAAELPLTPAQTEGPYYPTTKPAETDADLTRIGAGPQAKGEVLELDGKVVDPTGKAIEQARVEIWQTDHQGIYMHPGDGRTERRDRSFQFYGEVRTDAAGAFRFRTILPAPYSGRPRHIHAKITPPDGATLTTQFYFKADRELTRDAIVRRLGTAVERVMLMPEKSAQGIHVAPLTIVVRR